MNTQEFVHAEHKNLFNNRDAIYLPSDLSISSLLEYTNLERNIIFSSPSTSDIFNFDLSPCSTAILLHFAKNLSVTKKLVESVKELEKKPLRKVEEKLGLDVIYFFVCLFQSIITQNGFAQEFIQLTLDKETYLLQNNQNGSLNIHYVTDIATSASDVKTQSTTLVKKLIDKQFLK
jgi:hypothetical protein